LGQWSIDNHLQVRLLRHGKEGLMKDQVAHLGMIDFEEATTVQNNLMLRPPGTKLRTVPLQLNNQLI
jgi:hypothetical protein